MQNNKHTLTWLHLSDLHYCEPRDGWDAEAVLDALAEDLELMEDRHGLLPDLVFFTGDVAFGNMKKEKGWNLKDQYAGAAGFLDNIRCAFSDEIPKTNVFIVPGNHDVNRKSVTRAQTPMLCLGTRSCMLRLPCRHSKPELRYQGSQAQHGNQRKMATSKKAGENYMENG